MLDAANNLCFTTLKFYIKVFLDIFESAINTSLSIEMVTEMHFYIANLSYFEIQ